MYCTPTFLDLVGARPQIPRGRRRGLRGADSICAQARLNRRSGRAAAANCTAPGASGRLRGPYRGKRANARPDGRAVAASIQAGRPLKYVRKACAQNALIRRMPKAGRVRDAKRDVPLFFIRIKPRGTLLFSIAAARPCPAKGNRYRPCAPARAKIDKAAQGAGKQPPQPLRAAVGSEPRAVRVRKHACRRRHKNAFERRGGLCYNRTQKKKQRRDTL